MSEGLNRSEYLEIINNVIQSTSKKKLAAIEKAILIKLKEIPNYNSDLYKPLSMAIQLITIKKQDISNSNQFIINIILASVSFLTALVVGILQILK
ncbi:MAG TPA: hypothetical protein PLA54_05330 [Spirochaetota bacterium]|nr:hypothetical protein [Spirochaetota bacterium]HQE58602.1 hypothetical protein [Spirochaetota bacterium]